MNSYPKLEIPASSPAPITVILRFRTFSGSTSPIEILVNGQSAEQSEAIYRFVASRFAEGQGR